MPSAIIYGQNATVDETVLVGEFSVIGKDSHYSHGLKKTSVAKGAKIGSHVIIYRAASIGEDTEVEDFCRIGEGASIGNNCRLIYGTKIYGEVIIGDNCIIAGFICEDVKIGDNCRIFGELIHSHRINPNRFHDLAETWDKGGEAAPVIGNNVFIGFGAKIIGGIAIGNGSYILPNAIVNKDVPANMQVKNINQMEPIKK